MLKTHSEKQGTRIRIPWRNGAEVSSWNETCIWAIENFGLPGNNNYMCQATEQYMDYWFVDEKDAIRFALRWL